MSGVLVSYLDRQSQVVPKCPAMLFKKQLIDFLQKIYGMMRDNLKKEILPHLEYCKQVMSSLLRLCLSIYLIHLG